MNMLHFHSSSSSTSSSEEEYVVVRRRKVYKERSNCFDKYNDEEFFDRFHLMKTTVRLLLKEIEPAINHNTNKGGCIKPVQQLLLALRFYATGSMQIAVADFMGVSKASASRIIRRVSTAIATLRPRYINMYENRRDMEKSAQEFYSIASFPYIIGAISCTLIKIASPGGEDAEIFRSHKGYFAMNVQTVSDTSLKIRDIVARWPGSVHNQTIFDNSYIKQKFRNGMFGRYILVSSNGYALEPYLMTKIQEPRTSAENLYNQNIIRTRNVVEKLYSVWKRRFPILRLGMRLNLNRIMEIIVATAVLHNIAIDMNDPYPDEEESSEQEEINELDEEKWEDEEEEEEETDRKNNAKHYRELLISEHFGKL